MVKISHLYKKYKGSNSYTISDISFEIPNGKVVGILGKNGAGKSTTIKSICNIFPFDKGAVTINGKDIKKFPQEAKMLIGYSPDDHSIYEQLGGRECLNYVGSLYHLDSKTKAKRAEYLSKLLDIEYALDNKISSYSHGMKQKICLCASLLHSPKFWVLDEPMLGLDPQTKEQTLKLIRDYANKGNCVLFSSHDIYTVSKICDSIVIIAQGKVADIIDMKNTKKYNTLQKLEKHFKELSK